MNSADTFLIFLAVLTVLGACVAANMRWVQEAAPDEDHRLVLFVLSIAMTSEIAAIMWAAPPPYISPVAPHGSIVLKNAYTLLTYVTTTIASYRRGSEQRLALAFFLVISTSVAFGQWDESIDLSRMWRHLERAISSVSMPVVQFP